MQSRDLDVASKSLVTSLTIIDIPEVENLVCFFRVVKSCQQSKIVNDIHEKPLALCVRDTCFVNS
jgi:hypothetical protein